MKMNNNRKGMHMLNATEGTITFVLIVAAIFLLFSSGSLNTGAANKNVLTIQNNYLTLQMMRTFSQTPLTVDGETMTVAQALNEFYSLDSLDSKDFTAKERRIHARKKQDLTHAIAQLCKNSLAPLISSKYSLITNLYFKNKLATHQTEFYICKGTSSNSDGLEVKEQSESIQLPANLNLKYEQTADYYINLSIS